MSFGRTPDVLYFRNGRVDLMSAARKIDDVRFDISSSMRGCGGIICPFGMQMLWIAAIHVREGQAP